MSAAAIRWLGLLALCFLISGALPISPLHAQAAPLPPVADVPYQPPAASPRYSVFVSDLHFGVGKTANGAWNPTEDFRWPKALRGFVNRISQLGQERVDLIIVGDFLELWQPPADIPCKGVGADLGCSIEEMSLLVQKVVEQHAGDLAILRAFAERGENRLHVIVGNHDSTLRYAPVWKSLGAALNAASGRIELVTKGVWVSGDGRILAEHGHQIGKDVNRYETWPDIVRQVDGKNYIVRPWGELFVQRLFNAEEAVYPIIDNLSPETAGARYRAADRGFWSSAGDIARLVAFNLLETSLSQKIISLGKPPAGKVTWNVEIARKMGSSLFLFALDRTDPMRLQLEAGGPDADAIKSEMTVLAKDAALLPDEEVQQICDLIALKEPDNICWDSSLGSLAENLLEAKSDVLAKHLTVRQAEHISMRVFIYGHTHQFEEPWSVVLPGSVNISIANTGAFQRLINEAGFLARLKGRTPQEALRTMSLDELPPCYTAILVPPVAAGQIPVPEVKAWHMPEDGPGAFTSTDDSRCVGTP
jgi:UDP-2,3-diacylglucosamine pyrophosphatase LpxH